MAEWWWSYLLAAGGIAGIWLAGRKDPRGWLLGLLMQVLWAAYAIVTGQYGFLVTAVGYGLVYGRNWLAWRGE